jgi:hypothetical protein
VILPETTTFIPSSGTNESDPTRLLHITPAICADSSFNVKYMCPEVWILKFDNSP